MKVAALGALLLLAACSEERTPVSRADAEDIADAAARRTSDDFDSRMTKLEQRIDAIEAKQRDDEATVDGISQQVSHNAKVSNDNSLKDMTRRGACGTEAVQTEGGGYVVQNKKCTDNDLLH